MSGTYQVLREIPPHLITGINNGTYTVHGGVVRDLGGRIVVHLKMGSDALKNGNSIVNSLPQCFAALQQATLCLQGVNLAVNVAGFAIVCEKLNAMNQKLDAMSDKMEHLLAGQKQAEKRA